MTHFIKNLFFEWASVSFLKTCILADSLSSGIRAMRESISSSSRSMSSICESMRTSILAYNDRRVLLGGRTAFCCRGAYMQSQQHNKQQHVKWFDETSIQITIQHNMTATDELYAIVAFKVKHIDNAASLQLLQHATLLIILLSMIKNKQQCICKWKRIKTQTISKQIKLALTVLVLVLRCLGSLLTCCLCSSASWSLKSSSVGSSNANSCDLGTCWPTCVDRIQNLESSSELDAANELNSIFNIIASDNMAMQTHRQQCAVELQQLSRTSEIRPAMTNAVETTQQRWRQRARLQ